jgi:hypothetical protein
MAATLEVMANKQQATDRHKPSKTVRLPMPLALALEELAEAEFNNLTDQVVIACRLYLESKGKMPKPPKSRN